VFLKVKTLKLKNLKILFSTMVLANFIRLMFKLQSLVRRTAYCKLSEMPAALPDMLACFQLAFTVYALRCDCRTQLFDNAASKDVSAVVRGVSRLGKLTLIAVERELSDRIIQNPDKIFDVFANLPDKLRRLELYKRCLCTYWSAVLTCIGYVGFIVNWTVALIVSQLLSNAP
jgi:hypothetical protein